MGGRDGMGGREGGRQGRKQQPTDMVGPVRWLKQGWRLTLGVGVRIEPHFCDALCAVRRRGQRLLLSRPKAKPCMAGTPPVHSSDRTQPNGQPTSVPSSCRKMSSPLLAHSLARVLLLVVASPISSGTTYARTASRRASAAAAADSAAGCARGSPTAGRAALEPGAAPPLPPPPAAAAAAAAATCSDANLRPRHSHRFPEAASIDLVSACVACMRLQGRPENVRTVVPPVWLRRPQP